MEHNSLHCLGESEPHLFIICMSMLQSRTTMHYKVLLFFTTGQHFLHVSWQVRAKCHHRDQDRDQTLHISVTTYVIPVTTTCDPESIFLVPTAQSLHSDLLYTDFDLPANELYAVLPSARSLNGDLYLEEPWLLARSRQSQIKQYFAPASDEAERKEDPTPGTSLEALTIMSLNALTLFPSNKIHTVL
jgi:hypothetical protein